MGKVRRERRAERLAGSAQSEYLAGFAQFEYLAGSAQSGVVERSPYARPC